MKPTVAIIGLGLMGGSLGLALRRGKRYRVVGIARRTETLRDAKRLGAIDEGSTDLRVVVSADIVVIATPVDRVVPTFKQILPFLKSGAIVTDVGSVKGPIMKAVAGLRLPRSIRFVGGHPLAGSHKTGVKAAHSRLYEGSTVVLVADSRASLMPLKSLWRAAGAESMVLSARDHDLAVAFISHVPHLIAHALTLELAGRRERKRLVPLLAGSFRDATRVAASDPDQWTQIFRANAAPIAGALEKVQRQLARMGKEITRPRLTSLLKKSQTFRRSLFNGI